MIQAEHLQKTFRVRKRNAGFKNAAKAFFSREYEEIHALNDVSFRIEDGEAVGDIGPNGAGKSSTIKILSGILTPDSGTCVIDGRVPWKDRRAHVSQIGVVFGQRSQLWWDVPVIDSFELIRDIYAVTEDVYKRNLRDLTDLLNLSEILKTPARSLSLGQRMRCEIAASLLHDPRILFLDEPTIGLDAVSKIAVREFVLDMNKRRGTTVILTTHDMQDVEALAQRVLLIGKGRILLDGTLDDIRRGGSGQIDETLAALYKQFDISRCAVKLKKYISFFRLRCVTGLQYRAAALAGISTQFAWGFLIIFAYHAFYRSNPTAFPMTLQATVNDTWIQQAFLAMFASWVLDGDILEEITSGSISYSLCRPVDLYAMWYTKSLSGRISRVALRAVPILVVAALLPAGYNLTAPTDLPTFFLFLLTMVLGALNSTAFTLLIYVLTMYTLSLPPGCAPCWSHWQIFSAAA